MYSQQQPYESIGASSSQHGRELELPEHDESPLAQMGFLKDFNAEKKQTKDGAQPKRRGPKPDSKPALTRRQELNRQAQRTHRERKEMYIKALEQEVLRLKELYTKSVKERDQVVDENRRLKELLASHGISYDFGQSPIQFQRGSNYNPSSSGSISGSYRPPSDSTSFSPPSVPGQLPPVSPRSHHTTPNSMAQLPSSRLDYDQIGIDFVLALERPCMEHMTYLLVRSHNPDGQFFHHPGENKDDSEHEHMAGHAMMASAPSHSHIMETPSEPHPHKMPDIGVPDLAKLLDLSNRLPIDREGEITPIMAWTVILKEPRIAELDEVDFEALKTSLKPKVVCYGFGAVVEEFEVRDALYPSTHETLRTSLKAR
ncbi:hypothetical protein AMS68_002585 [Peltaster fructicola]|uniref:BZIP domain-containing protein n=1 Tax=Peltaster fructicola TaxID=286661 RepID=A0A6H0XR04_9PEZI|nr:hypothetical protein AMS68_002585 [Peltaster fructicola]